MSAPILVVENLAKNYRSHKKEPGLKGSLKALFRREYVDIPAVKPLSFSIAKGEFVGLLGPNGAGKTTTLKMLSGLIRPTSGSMRAFDQYDPSTRDRRYLRRIGMVMGQRNQLNSDLPAIDSFRLAQVLYDIDDVRFKKRLDTCLDLFAIRDKLLLPVRKLSLGERMKMELILSLIHEPDLLFLDEPTIGLDFNAAKQIRDFLKEANRTLGLTIILTSHYTKDIEELCRRVILINHGSVVFDGPLTGVDKRIQGQRDVIITCIDKTAQGLVTSTLGSIPAARVTPPSDTAPPDSTSVAFSCPPDSLANVLGQVASHHQTAISDIKIGERPLEDIFSEIYQQPTKDAGVGAPHGP